MIPLREYQFGARPMVVAHRGSSGTAPENTMVAIREGVEAGAEMVEIDIQETSDGRLILFHDHVLGRTTNGTGQTAHCSYQEISKLDAGGWMDARYAGEPVPLLDTVLQYIQGKAYLNIELKRHANSKSGHQHFLEATLEALTRHNMLPYTLLSSFDHQLLADTKRACPEAACAVILHPEDRAMPSERAFPVGAEAIVMGKHQLSHRRATDARTHKLPLAIYTINTPEDVRNAIKYGIQAIVTNFPAQVIEVLADEFRI